MKPIFFSTIIFVTHTKRIETHSSVKIVETLQFKHARKPYPFECSFFIHTESLHRETYTVMRKNLRVSKRTITKIGCFKITMRRKKKSKLKIMHGIGSGASILLQKAATITQVVLSIPHFMHPWTHSKNKFKEEDRTERRIQLRIWTHTKTEMHALATP